MRIDGNLTVGAVGRRLPADLPVGSSAARPTRRARTAALGVLVCAVLVGCASGGPAADTSASATPSSAAASKAADPTLLPPTPAPTPLLNEEPDPNSTVGGLAPGFPSDLLPVPAGVEVLVSSVDPVGDSSAYQVSLNLRTVLSATQIVDVYRQTLTAGGFAEAEQTTPDAALAAQTTFTRSAGDEVLVIGVLDRDGVRTVTIGGRLRTAG
ncbi:hypothetical protein [Pengzhenrongella frigida]|uniref:Uncharacterized protein n=1 Tax=Pengzhenrongella frigida TaxID=1259133 RepID=A0A4Q5MXG5_9MICO|nr:hypothetical protein [Cellulomonas sp. HLT2-17]RYV50329.1 hypothetical protein EUA98_14055 [Cellulomonas sp. HLT2-17]